MASPHQHIVAYPVEKVMDATLRALTQLHYKIDRVDRENGSINFKTGISIRSMGQQWSILISTTAANDSVINFDSQLKVGAFDWGEASQLRTKLIRLIDQNLSTST